MSGEDYLFKTQDGEESQNKLPEEQAQVFHCSVAQLLFLCVRARPDIQTAISFLIKRVISPEKYDRGKLKQVLGYLKGTFHMRLRIRVDNMRQLRWYVDASYCAHMDTKVTLV